MSTTTDPQVTVYSSPTCTQCRATYTSLEKKGIAYRVVDVTEDEQAMAHILALGYKQVPVVETPTDHWAGLRPDKLMHLKATLN